MLAVEGKRVTLSLGHQARLQKFSSRQVVRLAPAAEATAIPDRLSAPPWCLTAAAVDTATPNRRDLAAVWLLLQESGQGVDFADWVDTLLTHPTPAQRAAAWLWLQSDQLWFSQRHDLIWARPLAELRLQREARRTMHLRQQAQRAWHALVRARQPIDAAVLAPPQRAELELLVDRAGVHSSSADPWP
ncbi:MAG: hypothetical protein FJ077_07210, partial [Cyanobacteria bacterium K_DeepCast_35m_m2_023]|nr:hypothetical protein [Cyanobacteria bacterium K_DeepCast_35m_m2_023]